MKVFFVLLLVLLVLVSIEAQESDVHVEDVNMAVDGENENAVEAVVVDHSADLLELAKKMTKVQSLTNEIEAIGAVHTVSEETPEVSAITAAKVSKLQAKLLKSQTSVETLKASLEASGVDVAAEVEPLLALARERADRKAAFKQVEQKYKTELRSLKEQSKTALSKAERQDLKVQKAKLQLELEEEKLAFLQSSSDVDILE